MMSPLKMNLDSMRGALATLFSSVKAFAPRLLLAMVLLPLGALAQEGSSIDVETGSDVWTFCSGAFQPGFVMSPLTLPATPTVGDGVSFRIRKNNTASTAESLDLHGITYAETSEGPFLSRSPSEVQFSTVRGLPATFPGAGEEAFDIFFTPTQTGIYRFTFFSGSWDGGSCSVDVPVSEGTCLIRTVEGIDQSGNASQNHLDFGTVPVGESVDGVLLFTFTEPFFDEGIVYTSVSPPFTIADGFGLSPDLNTAQWDVGFMPTAPGPFEETVQFYAVRDEGNESCPVDVVLEGIGGDETMIELSLTFGDLVCGDELEIPVVLSNLSSVALDRLDARPTTKFSLMSDPPESFNVSNFTLGPAGSTEVPSQRGFVLHYPLTGIPANPQITITQAGTPSNVLLREAIPDARCIQIVDPTNLTVNFGDVVVGETGPDRSIVIANRGSSSETVTALLGSSGASQGFDLGEGGSLSLTIPPSSQEMVPVTFVPPSLGPKQSVVSFMSEVPVDIPSVNLIGNGVDQPRPSLSYRVGGTSVNPGSTIRFPSTQLGQTNTLPLVVTNDGTLGVLGLSVTVPNGEFSVSGSSPAELAPNQSASYTLTFQPSQAGTRTGQLTLDGENIDTVLFSLEGVGAVGSIDIGGVGLSANIEPAQTPLPTIGLEMRGGPAAETLEGDLLLEFVPNIAQTPSGFLSAYQAVRFMAGSGADGRTMRFRFAQGQQQATFPGESGGALASFQSGTVAGTIQFRLANVQTTAGVAVPVVDPLAGSAVIDRRAPQIRSMTSPTTGTGINVVVDAVSTTREITGVCLALTAASGTQLSFTRPDAAFLNDAFTQWFLENPDSFAPGGSFVLTIPIDISNMATFGSAQAWLRNSEGWSGTNSPCQ